MLQLLGGRWERNPAAEQRICGRSHAQYAAAVVLGLNQSILQAKETK